MRRIVALLIFITVVTTANVLAQKKKWELVEKNDFMKIYSRMPESSSFKELKINLIINAPLSSIVAVLDNVSAYPDWIYSCTESYFVKEKKEGHSIYYILLDLPWPLSDRDIVSKSHMKQNSKNLKITINTKNISGKVKKKEDVVRVPKNIIKWEIEPITKNKSEINYYVKSNPGGLLPVWLVNMSVEIGPKRTMTALKKRAEKIKVDPASIYIEDL